MEWERGESRQSRDMMPHWFRERVALSRDMGAYVKKSVVMCGGETGLAAPWTAGSSPSKYTTEPPRAQALSGEKIFQKFCAVYY